MFLSCAVQPPSFMRNASARRPAGMRSKPVVAMRNLLVADLVRAIGKRNPLVADLVASGSRQELLHVGRLRQRPESVTPIAGDARGAERVADRARREADQERSLQRQR